MIHPASVPTVASERNAQRRLQLIGYAAVLLCALGSLASFGSERLAKVLPLALLMLCVLALAAGLLLRKPVVAVYAFIVASLCFEQWPIPGLDPITTQTRFWQTMSGAGLPIPLPVSPAELLLLGTLALIILPAAVGRGPGIYGGALAKPMLLFLAAILGAFLYGYVKGPSGTVWNANAAWAEARSFVYMVVAYFLAATLISSRARVVRVVWLVLIGVGLKGVQGIYSFWQERRRGLELDAITGHEDVVFFSLFFLLVAALVLYAYGREPRQLRASYIFIAPVLFTTFATTRRIAFFVLAAGFIVVALALWRTRPRLFSRLAPVVLVVLLMYTAAFWNNSGSMFGQPIRAFKSQFGEASERDMRSDLWRDQENINVDLNIRSAPLTGLGFGRPYTFFVEQASLDSTGFVYWIYITHNAVFWVWMKMGMAGFLAFWYLMGSGIAFGLITFRTLRDGYLRAVALTVVGLVVMQVLFSYGDLGLTYARSMILLGCMLGVLARLPEIARQPVEEPADAATPAPARSVRTRKQHGRRQYGRDVIAS